MEQTTPGDPPTAPSPPGMTIDTVELSQAVERVARDGHSPRVSAPPTPTLRTPLSRRTSTASMNLQPKSPRPPSRRSSSSMSLSKPASSPALRKKSSRTSLGATDEQEQSSTPKRSISNLIAGLRESQTRMESIEEPTPLTSAQLAASHFTKELLAHGEEGTESDVVVILHDACYGHRWSRLKTTKGQLSLIVERPERINASVLGASTAYVRLGGHHEGGERPPHPNRSADARPPFKIRRTARVIDITSPYVTAVHGTEWMDELRGMCGSAPEKLAAGVKEVGRSAGKEQLHDGDLYLAPGSLDAFQGALGGVADAVDAVFAPDARAIKAFVAVRPPGHHCSADHPSGFCWLNNVHVGIEYAAQLYDVTHAAIFDFDLHHGDGSQAIAWQRNSKNNEKRQNAKPNSKLKLTPDIGYYSLHDINSYPCEWGDDAKVQAASLCIENAHSQSIWNVHLQPWKTGDEFWELYEQRYRVLIEKARVFLQYHSNRIRMEGKVRPNAAIFISAGFDASEWEGQGMQRHKVSVPTEFYARFTEDVVKLASEVEGCQGRVISVLEGGYSDRALCSGVLSHLSGLCATTVSAQSSGFDELMNLSNKMNGLSMNQHELGTGYHYDKTWWTSDNLTALEHKINPPPPPQAKKFRVGPQPTYATPTESFAYKVVDTNKFARSISGTMRDVPRPDRAPTPPPPEVDWVVATQELSKLLIPQDRQTKSCTSEELTIPRVKKELAPISRNDAAPSRQLRDRKAKGPAYAESTHSDESAASRAASRNESRASRRETIDILPSQESAATQQRRLSRRLSAGSALTITDALVDGAAPPVPALPGSRPSGSMKPPPVPVPANKKARVPAKAARAVTSSTSAPSSPAAKSAAAAASTRPAVIRSNTSDKPSEVDGLANGIKKITLKAPASKEEHERRQMEKLNADRRARALKGAETRRVNAAAKKAAQSSAQSSAQPAAQASAPKPGSKIAPGIHAVEPAPPAVIAAHVAAAPTGSSLPAMSTNPATSGLPLAAMPVTTHAKENVAPSLLDDKKALVEPSNFIGHGAADRSASDEINQLQTAIARPEPQTDSSHFVKAVASTSIPSPAATASSGNSMPSLASTSSEPATSVNPASITTMPSKLAKPSQFPIFSSTGYIPFSTTNASEQGPRTVGADSSILDVQTQQKQEEPQEKSICDVPDSPAR
ncbi:hypothetical protein CBER1_02154 [Cercospora berteroae]|uniref:Histone deacetylase domain-containing protein n=1 Tax=Cercospora berteroae TaxID=357750 RepID=A0A2S6BQ91_9PEZI|nr:hypothetical protein CBER1_02154 [Cercospora berteroae]